MNFQQIIMILMTRQPHSVKGRRSPQRREIPKSIRQDSPGQGLEREEVPLDYSFNQTFSPPTINPNRFCFSPDMDKASELAEKTLNGEFPVSPDDIRKS